MENNKDGIRKRLLQLRGKLAAEEVEIKSDAILAAIRNLDVWKRCGVALLYYPIRNEVNVLPLLYETISFGDIAFLPRCRKGAKARIDVAEIKSFDDLKLGPFEIMEPDCRTCPTLENVRPDVAVIPGVGFDRRGYRIGFGKGYYDNLLSMPFMRDTVIIAPAYSFQIVDEINPDPWDRRVHIICTEERTIWME